MEPTFLATGFPADRRICSATGKQKQGERPVDEGRVGELSGDVKPQDNSHVEFLSR
jgi:hypothetical protein